MNKNVKLIGTLSLIITIVSTPFILYNTGGDSQIGFFILVPIVTFIMFNIFILIMASLIKKLTCFEIFFSFVFSILFVILSLIRGTSGFMFHYAGSYHFGWLLFFIIPIIGFLMGLFIARMVSKYNKKLF